jgi:aspartate 1-decarboxylase
MRRSLFKSKIHRATVTDADLAYEGSVTIDAELMRAADILPYERVQLWDVSNGSRLETYALEGEPGSGVVCVNGAAAHHVRPGDVVIIATFAEAESEAEARAWKPTVVRVDAANRLVAGPRAETPGPALPIGFAAERCDRRGASAPPVSSRGGLPIA